MRTFIKHTAIFLVVGSALFVEAHSLQETNLVVRTALRKVLSNQQDDYGEVSGRVVDELPNTWNAFLPDDVAGGWSFESKLAAFDWYLGNVCTNDFRVMGEDEVILFQVALDQCQMLNYTNSLPHMISLALNPHTVMKMKESAIEMVVKYGHVSSNTTKFVEAIMTNKVGYTKAERGASACGSYAEMLRSFDPTNEVQRITKKKAVQMLYSHRLFDVAGAKILDELFSVSLDGYQMSSNRLETAVFVLSHPECDEFERRDFIGITNQLLSAGQPLQQLNLEGDEQ